MPGRLSKCVRRRNSRYSRNSKKNLRLRKRRTSRRRNSRRMRGGSVSAGNECSFQDEVRGNPRLNGEDCIKCRKPKNMLGKRTGTPKWEKVNYIECGDEVRALTHRMADNLKRIKNETAQRREGRKELYNSNGKLGKLGPNISYYSTVTAENKRKAANRRQAAAAAGESMYTTVQGQGPNQNRNPQDQPDVVYMAPENLKFGSDSQ